MSLYCILFKLFYGLSFYFLPPLDSGLIKSHFLSSFTPFLPSFNFAFSIVMADHSCPRHRRKCSVCTRLMRSGDNHPDKCRSCHGCTVDNKCDICSRWTDQVWVGKVEHSTARLNRKRCVISVAPASDTPSTPPHSALIDARSHKRAHLQISSMSSGSFHGFSPGPSPEITQDRDQESVLAEILQLLREQRVLPTVVSDAANRPCAPGASPRYGLVLRAIRENPGLSV